MKRKRSIVEQALRFSLWLQIVLVLLAMMVICASSSCCSVATKHITGEVSSVEINPGGFANPTTITVGFSDGRVYTWSGTGLADNPIVIGKTQTIVVSKNQLTGRWRIKDVLQGSKEEG